MTKIWTPPHHYEHWSVKQIFEDVNSPTVEDLYLDENTIWAREDQKALYLKLPRYNTIEISLPAFKSAVFKFVRFPWDMMTPYTESSTSILKTWGSWDRATLQSCGSWIEDDPSQLWILGFLYQLKLSRKDFDSEVDSLSIYIAAADIKIVKADLSIKRIPFVKDGHEPTDWYKIRWTGHNTLGRLLAVDKLSKTLWSTYGD